MYVLILYKRTCCSVIFLISEKMKQVILTLTLVFGAVRCYSSDDQNLAIAKCIQRTGINESVVTRMGITLEIPDTSIVKKFLMCLNNKLGFQDEDGQMLFDKMRERLVGLTAVEVNSTISTCKQVRGTNSIENSYLATKCIFKKIKSIIKLKKRK